MSEGAETDPGSDAQRLREARKQLSIVCARQDDLVVLDLLEEGIVATHDALQELGEEPREVRADGGQHEPVEVDPALEPEYVGTHSGCEPGQQCGAILDADGTLCHEPATHTQVMKDENGLHELPRCNECGEPEDVADWGRKWSGERPASREPSPIGCVARRRKGGDQ